jgi:hypothetical protein
MNSLPINALLLRHSLPNILSLHIKLLALQQQIKDPKIRLRINSRSSTETPSFVVGCEIAVDKVSHEMAFAHPPVEEVLCEEGSDDHSAAVVHVATVVELAHCCIDYWVAGFAFAPSFEVLLVVFPSYVVYSSLKGLFILNKLAKFSCGGWFSYQMYGQWAKTCW